MSAALPSPQPSEGGSLGWPRTRQFKLAEVTGCVAAAPGAEHQRTSIGPRAVQLGRPEAMSAMNGPIQQPRRQPTAVDAINGRMRGHLAPHAVNTLPPRACPRELMRPCDRQGTTRNSRMPCPRDFGKVTKPQRRLGGEPKGNQAIELLCGHRTADNGSPRSLLNPINRVLGKEIDELVAPVISDSGRVGRVNLADIRVSTNFPQGRKPVDRKVTPNARHGGRVM